MVKSNLHPADLFRLEAATDLGLMGQRRPQRSGLKNVLLVDCDPPRLYEKGTGNPIPAYNAYSRNIRKKRGKKRSAATNTQYLHHNAGLMDYLYESRALGTVEVDPQAVSETLQGYFTFLTEGIHSDDYVIRTVAKRLGREPISVVSALKYRAAANDFLRRYAGLIRDSISMLNVLNPGALVEPPMELNELAPRPRGKTEIERLRSKIMVFSDKPDDVFQLAPGGLDGGRASKDNKRKDFPSRHILALLDNLPPLEKVVALLQCGGSLRQSETWVVKNSEINAKARTLRVEDPNHLRDPSAKDLPNKGRTTAHIHMFEPFKSMFWEALAEYKAIRPTSDSDLLFVSDQPGSYGKPLIETIKFNSLNRRINRALAEAQKKAKISKPLNNHNSYTSHSLRHFYGYWARNFVYIPGRRTVGLPLNHIQILMGHAELTSTVIYAKLDEEVMMAEIYASEQMTAMWDKTKSIDSLRADAFEALANDLRRRRQ